MVALAAPKIELVTPMSLVEHGHNTRVVVVGETDIQGVVVNIVTEYTAPEDP